MYSTLPPALAELISNAYDADSGLVKVSFVSVGSKKSITVKDDGYGMSADDIQNKFLVIGRNRRQEDGDKPTSRFGRFATGKKGLGKLALFGLAKVIVVDTIRDGKRNKFKLDWDVLLSSKGSYKPLWEITEQTTKLPNSTTIKLSELKRQSPFDVEAIADSLSRIFIVDSNFQIELHEKGKVVFVSNERRYAEFDTQFSWNVSKLAAEDEEFASKVSGALYTSKTPVKPNSGLRGISLFSRGKLVNAPEFFSSSTSSHFYQYLTGWISVDFIDTLADDVISTNRQSVDWDNEEMVVLRNYLSSLVTRVKNEWRDLRKETKEQELEEKTGIDTAGWINTMPSSMQAPASAIIEMLSKEDALEKFTPVIQALHQIIPEYPMLHWRHLDELLKGRVEPFYVAKLYSTAADQATKIYFDFLRELTGIDMDGSAMADNIFPPQNPKVRVTQCKTQTEKNIQQGQQFLSKGVAVGFRNPAAHEPADKLVPEYFSELDCLNILSLVSYLVTRAKGGELVVKEPV
nr:TIGR02391 family protein [Pseudomonas inefficax]